MGMVLGVNCTDAGGMVELYPIHTHFMLKAHWVVSHQWMEIGFLMEREMFALVGNAELLESGMDVNAGMPYFFYL